MWTGKKTEQKTNRIKAIPNQEKNKPQKLEYCIRLLWIYIEWDRKNRISV